MNTFLAPNGEYITVPDGRVTSFGLSDEQNKVVKNALPVKGYELLDTDVAGQIICYGFIKEVNDTYLGMEETLRKTVAPTLFILADSDPISDGSLAYQKSLATNGIATEVKKYTGALHGFIEENNPEYDILKTTSKSPEQEILAREAESLIGNWIESRLNDETE